MRVERLEGGAHGIRPLLDVRRRDRGGRATARPTRWLGGRQPRRGKRRLGGHQRVVVSGRQRLGDHRRAVARVEGGPRAVGGAAQVGGDIGRRAAVDLGRARPTTAARSRTWAAVAANHIRALGVCSSSSQPSRGQGGRPPGRRCPAVGGPAGTGPPCPSTWGRPARGARRGPEGLDRTLDVTEAEAQAGGVPGWTSRFVVARGSSTTGSSSSRAAGGPRQPRCAAGRGTRTPNSLRPCAPRARRPAHGPHPAGPGVLREPGERVHRAQVVAVGAEDLLDVVDRRHQVSGTSGMSSTESTATSGATGRRPGPPGRGRARARRARHAAGQVHEVLGSRGTWKRAWVRSVRATNSSANEPSACASRVRPRGPAPARHRRVPRRPRATPWRTPRTPGPTAS